MRQFALAILVFVTSCALFSSKKSDYEYCGKVDVLEVFIKNEATTCKKAMAVTNEAYELLWQKAAGSLNEPWRIEYMYGLINVEDPWAMTDYSKHLILVKSENLHNVFHELGHAYMSEMHSGGRSQHRKMCADKIWQKYESDFGVEPYCHLVRWE